MYNTHRGMIPSQPSNRLTDLLDQIRMEFDHHTAGASRALDQEREQLINSQIQEMEMFRNKMQHLEQTHQVMRAEYEKQITDLKAQLAQRPADDRMRYGPGQHEPAQMPPNIGHGPKDLFAPIMSGAQGGTGLAPPPQEAGHPSGLPAHLTQNAALNAGPQQTHPGYGVPVESSNGKGYGPPPHSTASPGPGQRGGRGGQPGPPPPAGRSAATPQQSHALPNPPSPRGAQHRAPYVQTPPPPPGQQLQRLPHQQQQLIGQYAVPDYGNGLGKHEHQHLPSMFKTVTDDWWVVYNPYIPRNLEVDLVHTLEHSSVVCCVRFSHDGKLVATGCNRAAQIYDTTTGRELVVLEDTDVENKDGDLYIRSVCFSPDGKYLATGAEDKIIRVWDIEQRRIKVSFRGHEQDIYALDFSKDGRTIASGSGDRTVRLWDVEAQKEQAIFNIEDGVTTVALSHDGRYVAAGSLDRSVRVWEVAVGAVVARLEGTQGHGDSVYSVAFHPSNREIVSGSLDKTIKLWEFSPSRQQNNNNSNSRPTQSSRCMRTFDGHADFVLSVALTPDGNWVLSGSKDRGVQFWDHQTGVAQLHLQGHRNSVISVAPSPTGNLFATGSGDAKARIWRYVEHAKEPPRR